MSTFGRWVTRHGLPAFEYDADGEFSEAAGFRHCLLVGNRRIQLYAAADGTFGLFDESEGLRWLTAPDPEGTGTSTINEQDASWGSAWSTRPSGSKPIRTFGPTWAAIRVERNGLQLERTVLCPEGELPWVLVRVQLSNEGGTDRKFEHVERWSVQPRFLNLFGAPQHRRGIVQQLVRFDVTSRSHGIHAVERRSSTTSRDHELPSGARLPIFGAPVTLMLEALDCKAGSCSARSDGAALPTLEIPTSVVLAAGQTGTLWFRFGVADEYGVTDPEALFEGSLKALTARLPQVHTDRVPEAQRELPWHAAILTGQACRDNLIGGHTLDQGSAYSYVMGFNGASRDPLQHAMPLVYSEPDLALSVLRNTCAWATPEGDLLYGLDGAKQPWTAMFQPSDTPLWALWLAAEYAAATGDLAAFGAPLDYHPVHCAPAAPVREHLRRQFRFFVDRLGRGEHGHVKIRNADWNDLAIMESGVKPELMISQGESVLNSAMAAWVLPVFAALADRIGEVSLSKEARQIAGELRLAVASAWNGRWFNRAYVPGHPPLGVEDCWLETQPWAILCGAATEDQARSLLQNIEKGPRAGSPLGARVRWPVPQSKAGAILTRGEATHGGIWYSINSTLVWAAAHVSPDLAWDEWRRMLLATHTEAHPDIWEGTLSGPDCWNAPESTRPGRTWLVMPGIGMQTFPVNNLHSHAQPLLAFLRLLGIEPTPDGSLRIGASGEFRSPTLRVSADGHGSLEALGPVVLETAHGKVRGGPGRVSW